MLVDDLLLLPFRGLLGVFQKISEMADREVNDAAYLQEKLLEIQLLYEMDEISEEEYALKAATLEDRLNAVREAAEEAEADTEGIGSAV